MTTVHGAFPRTRLRRLRLHEKLRDLVRETQLTTNDLIMPLFVRHGTGIKTPVEAMPGTFQQTVDRLHEDIANIVDAKIPGVLLFGVPEYKDEMGTSALEDTGVVQQAIRAIKKQAPELLVMVDLCYCEYTDHGHCGVISDINGRKELDNDPTLDLLAQQAVSLARAGADVIAPSGNVDGMVLAIRDALDQHGFQHVAIQSYAVKYSSALYGPFREATEGAPQFGDRRSYQMDPANRREALRECNLDIIEGADMLMIKPAHTYLDVIFQIKQAHPHIPLSAYHPSGEYVMIKAAAEKGWLDERKVVMEVLTSIKRAGADFIFTYYAVDVARWLQGG